MKTCSKCGEEKKLDDYYAAKTTADGKRNACKDCMKAYGASLEDGVGSWNGMRSRCNNPKHPMYAHYGGRGVKCCLEWSTFKQFIKDMGPKPTPKHQIDRIDNDGNYEPSNCRWVTCTENNRKKQSTKLSLNEAEDIRTLIKIGLTQRFIAKLYGVSNTTISCVNTGKTWRCEYAAL